MQRDVVVGKVGLGEGVDGGDAKIQLVNALVEYLAERRGHVGDVPGVVGHDTFPFKEGMLGSSEHDVTFYRDGCLQYATGASHPNWKAPGSASSIGACSAQPKGTTDVSHFDRH